MRAQLVQAKGRVQFYRELVFSLTQGPPPRANKGSVSAVSLSLSASVSTAGTLAFIAVPLAATTKPHSIRVGLETCQKWRLTPVRESLRLSTVTNRTHRKRRNGSLAGIQRLLRIDV